MLADIATNLATLSITIVGVLAIAGAVIYMIES